MEPPERTLTAAQQEDEDRFENSLRPRFLREFIGQEQIKANLSIAIQAALKARPWTVRCSSALPGLGKTTLAQIIANELGGNFRSTAGPTIEKRAPDFSRDGLTE